MRVSLVVVLATYILVGCTGVGNDDEGQASNIDCFGGMADILSFGSTPPSKVKATFTRHFATGPDSVWTINECGSNQVEFDRYDDKIYVLFGDWGMPSPESFDLKVQQCNSTHLYLNLTNVIPAAGFVGQFCKVAESSHNAN